MTRPVFSAEDRATVNRVLATSDLFPARGAIARLLADYDAVTERAEQLEQVVRTPSAWRDRPEIICLCGSSRFIEHFAVFAWELEKGGKIVFSLHLLPASYPGVANDHQAEAEGIGAQMDELHLRKIDLSDRVIVLNVGGYIGDSTRREIAYAVAHGKPVSYLESLQPHSQTHNQKDTMTNEQIARVTHEANRAYCIGLGDASQPSWENAPAWQRESAIAGVTAVVDGTATTPEQQHESWLAQKEADGWIYGETKDAAAKTHPCMVAYNELPTEQRAKDHLFRAVVIALTAAH